MQKYNADQLMELLSARLGHGMYVEGEGSICTDTRRLKEGDWFVALCGQSFDGHDFLGDAFSAGARGALVEERLQYSLGNKTFPLLCVDDTFSALALLARERKRLSQLPVMAISFHGEREETNRLFDFALMQIEERGKATSLYLGGNPGECLDRYINLDDDTVFLINIPNVEEDWDTLLSTLTPEIFVQCSQPYDPPSTFDADTNNYDSRIITHSEKTNVSNETMTLAGKWQLNPNHAAAIVEALDQTFPKIKAM